MLRSTLIRTPLPLLALTFPMMLAEAVQIFENKPHGKGIWDMTPFRQGKLTEVIYAIMALVFLSFRTLVCPI